MFGIDDAIIAAGVTAAGGLIGNSMSASSAQSANDFSAQQYATRYQTTVKDMEAAGLNPMLAYSQGAGSAPSGTSYTAQNPFAGVSSAYQSVKTADPQAQRDTASAGEAISRTTLAQRTADKVVQEISNLKTDQERGNAVIRNLGQEFQNLVKQNWNLTEVGNQLRQSIDLMRKQGDQAVAQAALNDAQAQVQAELRRLTGHQAGIAGQDERAGASFGEVGKTVGQLRPFLELLWNALRRH